MLLPYAEQSSPSKAPKHLHDFIWYQALLQTSRTEMPKPGTCMVLCCAVLLVFLGLLEGRTAQWKKCDSQTDEKYWTWIPVLQISLGLGLHKEHFEGKDENKRVIRTIPLCSIASSTWQQQYGLSSTGIPQGNSSMGWDGWAKRVSSTIATKSEGVSAEGQWGFLAWAQHSDNEAEMLSDLGCSPHVRWLIIMTLVTDKITEHTSYCLVFAQDLTLATNKGSIWNQSPKWTSALVLQGIPRCLEFCFSNYTDATWGWVKCIAQERMQNTDKARSTFYIHVK